MNNNKKIVLITGCAKGGIGYEYCKAFAAQGCRVVASDLAHRLPDIDEPNGSDDTEVIEIDVADDKSVELAVAKVLERHGRIDVLVNNAGMGCTGPLAELNLDVVRRTWEVNTLGQLRMVTVSFRMILLVAVRFRMNYIEILMDSCDWTSGVPTVF